jgi:hypothetical protein
LSSASDIPTIFLESLLTTVETQTNLVVPKWHEQELKNMSFF